MDAATFIAAIKTAVHDSSVRGLMETLEHVPGRKPAVRLVELSEWFRSLSADDKRRIAQIVELAVHSGIFGMLATIDGVVAIESAGPKGQLQLSYQGDGTRRVLNASSDEFLHNLYQALVYEQVHGERGA
jgi:hypothetical protein